MTAWLALVLILLGQVAVPKDLRSQRDTWTPLMDVLGPARTRVTEAQLEPRKP